MPNYILYHASSVEEIHECCYSLLKYLDVYNLKPPAGHNLVVYTDKPALMEAFGSYFQSFELKDLKGADQNGGQYPDVKWIFDQHKGNILYLPPNAYPIKELDELFSILARGSVYKVQSITGQQQGAYQLPILAFNNEQQDIDYILRSDRVSTKIEFIDQYGDLKEFRKLLSDFYKRYQEESIPNQVKLMHSIDARQIQDHKNSYKQLPFHIKLLRKLLGKGWDISKYAKV